VRLAWTGWLWWMVKAYRAAGCLEPTPRVVCLVGGVILELFHVHHQHAWVHGLHYGRTGRRGACVGRLACTPCTSLAYSTPRLRGTQGHRISPPFGHLNPTDGARAELSFGPCAFTGCSIAYCCRNEGHNTRSGAMPEPLWWDRVQAHVHCIVFGWRGQYVVPWLWNEAAYFTRFLVRVLCLSAIDTQAPAPSRERLACFAACNSALLQRPRMLRCLWDEL
jgi:hypothetical protein